MKRKPLSFHIRLGRILNRPKPAKPEEKPQDSKKQPEVRTHPHIPRPLAG